MKLRFIGLQFVLFSVVAFSACSGNENLYGPWEAFTYERENEQVFRRSAGEYSTLNSCLNFLTATTKNSGESYFCGYDCRTTSSGGEDCAKVMGSPRNVLSGSAGYIQKLREEHEEEFEGAETKDEMLRRLRAEAYE